MTEACQMPRGSAFVVRRPPRPAGGLLDELGHDRVLGGLVIAAIDNGMGLQGYSAAAKYVVTAIVLLAAVALDSFAHRGRVVR